tara:strand:- start:34 stop:414 length:381 start_codon:yes stop_codon:yes gene_type:complete
VNVDSEKESLAKEISDRCSLFSVLRTLSHNSSKRQKIASLQKQIAPIEKSFANHPEPEIYLKDMSIPDHSPKRRHTLRLKRYFYSLKKLMSRSYFINIILCDIFYGAYLINKLCFFCFFNLNLIKN